MKFSPSIADLERSEREARQRVSPFDASLVMTYFAKVRQADLYTANTNIARAQIPHLVAEAEATGATIAKTAAGILSEHRTWALQDAKVEARRLRRKKNQKA